jgi:hypothetical protein
MKHLWIKKGTPDPQLPQLIRSWTCNHCGATKVRVTNTKDKAPRATVERRVSKETCTR